MMAKAKAALFAIVFLLFVQYTVSAEPFPGPTEIVFVKDGDTLFTISLQSYTDEERSRGASWFAIYDFNVDLGSINSQRTPIVLGTKGLTVNILVDQKLIVPHYLGDFPTPESVVTRYGVQTLEGATVDGFMPSSMTPPMAEAAPEPVFEPVTEATVEATATHEAAPTVMVSVQPPYEKLSVIMAESLPEPPLEPEAESIVEVLIEPDVEQLFDIPVALVAEPVLEPALEAETATEQGIELVPARIAIAGPETGFAETQARLSMPGGLETFAMLGVGFYGDSLGFNAEAGAQRSSGEMFNIESWPRNIILGFSLLYDGVVRDEIRVAIAGTDLRAGYRFILADFIPALRDGLNFRLTPFLLAGPAYQGIERSGRFIYQGLAWHLAPVVTLDVSPFKDGTFKPLGTGLSVGYHYYFSTMVLQNFHAGLYASWTF